MKSVRIVRYVGIMSCVGALMLGSGLASGQTPPQKQPTPPKTKPAEMPPKEPKTPSDQAAASQKAEKAGAMADHHFALEAAEGGIMEVELGKMAASKATNPDVKSFGQKMADDHGKANDELKSIASSKNITLPDETTVKNKHKAMLDRMEKLSGAAFDKAYMDDMVKDHTKDVAAFERESKSGKDAELKAFASKTLPTLQEHMKLAKETRTKLTAKGTN
jgi:putative membrane protein